MIVRLGYVAMSTLIKNASPSKTMTFTSFSKLTDRDAAIRKLERIAIENLHNTLRLLRHNRASDIKVYRFSSKLIPLMGHELLEDWHPIPTLAAEFQKIGHYVLEHGMRVSFHPDYFTVLSTPRPDVLRHSLADLERHTAMLDAMGLGENAKCNIHVGGSYGDKHKAGERFISQFNALSPAIQNRLTLENDDKTFTALETLEIAEKVEAPMVLDIHHHQVNHNGEDAVDLWPRILQTWEQAVGSDAASGGTFLPPPKIHVSSPRGENDLRSHADFVDVEPVLRFLRAVAPITPHIDLMLEAKMKDQALFRLMDDLKKQKGVTLLNQASVEL